jgi:predicted ATPase/DNA-binding winged helix-turn-helix (wHTH) protein/tetratricopeptide (TPR) repeat protein
VSTLTSAVPAQRVAIGAAIVDLVALRVERGDKVEPLTPLEVDLLAHLWANLDRVVSREELLRDVWRYRPGLVTRAVDNAVRRIRRKIEVDEREPAHLKSVYGRGYVLTGARSVPPSRAPEPASRNVWASPSSFVGRGVELDLLDSLLATGRLVTVTGPAGAGKTRLAREHAAATFAGYPGGVWEVQLADVEAADIGAAVAQVIEARTSDPATAIFRRGRVLVLLDNVEHLVDAAATALAGWLGRAPEARFLVTSRVPVRIDGEHLLELGPLAEPDAVGLLVDRASAAGCVLSAADRPVLARIARRLDRLPLSLELAAGRLGSLSLDAIERRIESGLQVLSGQRRDVPARHLSLEAAIAASWDLLDDDDQRALEASIVFRGGFGLEAFEEVLGDPDAGDRLAALHDRSLLRVERSPGALRYQVYEAVRAFAVTRADPAKQAEYAMRHAEYYARWGAALAEAFDRDERVGRQRALADEIGNLVAAHGRLLDVDPDLAAHAALALAVAYGARGPLSAADAVLTASLAAPVSEGLRFALSLGRGEIRSELVPKESVHDLDTAAGSPDPAVRARALRARSMMAVRANDWPLDRVVAALDRGLAAAEEAGQPHLVARLLVAMALTHGQRGDPAARERALHRAMELTRNAGNPMAEQRVASSLAFLRFVAGDYDRAVELLTPFVDGASGIDGASLVHNIGSICAVAERWVEAEAWLHDAIARARSIGAIDVLTLFRTTLGELYWEMNRPEESRAVLLECLAEDPGSDRGTRRSALLAALGRVAIGTGQPERAEELLAEAIRLGPKPWIAGAIDGDRGDLAWIRGDLAGARQRYEASSAQLERVGSGSAAGFVHIRHAALLALTDREASRSVTTAALRTLRSPSAPVLVDLVAGFEALGLAAREPENAPSHRRRAEGRLAAVPSVAPWPVRFLAARLAEVLQCGVGRCAP